MDRKVLLSVLFIFILGFVSRAYLFKYTYIFGFDSYYFARLVGYVVENGEIPKEDPLMYRGFDGARRMFLWPWAVSVYLPAIVYLVLFGSSYNPDKILFVLKLLPAVLGSLGSVVVFFIVSSLCGSVFGVLAGIFAATNPAYIYRTMSGFYEDDALGYLLITLTVFFAFKTYEERGRKRILFGVLSALSCYLAALSWKAFPLFYGVVLTFIPLLAIFRISDIVFERACPLFKREDILAVASAFLALVFAFFMKSLAYLSAGVALSKVGSVTETVIYMIAAPYPSFPLFALSAFYLVRFLRDGDKRKVVASLFFFVLAVLFFLAYSASPHELRIETQDGVEVSVGVPESGLGALLFGSALIVLGSQFIGSLLASLGSNGGFDLRKDVLFLGVCVILIVSSFLTAFTYGPIWFKPLAMFFEGRVAQVHGLGGKYGWYSILEPKLAGVITVTVGEETFGFLNWPAKYGILTLFLFFGVPVLVHRRGDARVVFILAWFLLTVYTAWVKLKMAYYLGIPIAIVSSVVLKEFYDRVEDKRFFYILALFLCFTMLSTGLYHTVTRIPTLLTEDEANDMRMFGGKYAKRYFELFDFLKTTPEDSNILNWWNIGHWITFFTGRGVTTDNTNIYFPADKYVAQFFLSPEDKAHEMAEKIGSDYVVFESSYFFTAPNFYIYATGKVNFKDENRFKYSLFVFPCEDMNTLMGRKIVCGEEGRVFKAYDINDWVNIPVLGFGDGETVKIRGVRFFVYRYGRFLYLVGEKLRDSVLYSFYTDRTKKFEKVWESSDGRIKVFKV